MKIALLLVVLMAAPVLGQEAPVSALKGLDSAAPIDVDAARIEVEDKENQAIFTGAVVIRQGRLTLNADTVKVLYERKGTAGPEMQRLDARGNVRLISPSESASSTNAIYDVPQRIITMLGNVTLDRGGSSLKGQRLVFYLDTGKIDFNARGGAAVPGAPAGRVTGRFLVPQRPAKP
jgi:lipopolysaccharide export system protein LptA